VSETSPLLGELPVPRALLPSKRPNGAPASRHRSRAPVSKHELRVVQKRFMKVIQSDSNALRRQLDQIRAIGSDLERSSSRKFKI